MNYKNFVNFFVFFSKFTDISVRDANETLILKIDKVVGIDNKNNQTPKFSTPMQITLQEDK